jgi:hypothetical protein
VAATLLSGQVDWSGSVDSEGYTTFKVTWLVRTNDPLDGPYVVLNTPGLPKAGDPWILGNDNFPWAWCRQEMTAKPIVTKEPNYNWEVEQTFSNKPPDNKSQKCQDQKVEDPLLEQPKISYSFANHREEATTDRTGKAIVTSSFEQIRGPQVEFDEGRLQIKIEMNVVSINLQLLEAVRNSVNSEEIWGFAPRTIRLANVSAAEQFYGQCYLYYKLSLEFEVYIKEDGSSGWDRDVLDEGTKVLNGHWHPTEAIWILDKIDGEDPNPRDPSHFRRFQDRTGECCKVVLNGEGLPAGAFTGSDGLFISIVASNTGNKLNNINFWVPIGDPDDDGTITIWDRNQPYELGDLVVLSGSEDGPVYVYVGETGFTEIPIPGGHTDWIDVGNANDLVDAGDYSTITAYDAGDIVRDRTGLTAGYIHVEKYAENDFLILGVPPILPRQ